MYVIVVYDISTKTKEGKKRLVRAMKKCREYLHHTQKSVFEGEITSAKLLALQDCLEKIIDKDTDYVLVYLIANSKNIKRKNIGVPFEPTSNII